MASQNIWRVLLTLLIITYFSPSLAGPLHDAALKGDTKKINQLIKQGIDVNSLGKIKGGTLFATPLHFAVLARRSRVVILLIANGANVNAKGKQDWSAPLHVTTVKGYIDIAKLLIAKGANVDAKGRQDDTPLLWAIKNSQIELVKLFIKHGANVNAKTKLGITPLHMSASAGNVEIARHLISKGANVNDRAEGVIGATPLHYAVVEGHKKIVILLLEKGADINARNDGGTTALAFAIAYKRHDIFSLLRKHGAKTQRGITAQSLSQKVYKTCMKAEVKNMKTRKEENPEGVAHFVCLYYKRICKENPDDDSCKKAVREYK